MRKTSQLRNQGMSLIELLVSVAVLGIAMVGIMALINLSTRYYANSSKEVEVQAELQTTFSMVSNMIVDANSGIGVDSDGAYKIVNAAEEYWLVLEGTNLYAKAFPKGTGDSDITEADNLLADHVSAFEIDTDHYSDGYVTMSMAVVYGSRNASMTKNVFLRNSETDSGSFFSECTVIKDETNAEFEITRADGVDPISSGTNIVIKMKLDIGASTVGSVEGNIFDVDTKDYNQVTGVLTLYCSMTSSWEANGAATLSVLKKDGDEESAITGNKAAIVGISK